MALAQEYDFEPDSIMEAVVNTERLTGRPVDGAHLRKALAVLRERNPVA